MVRTTVLKVRSHCSCVPAVRIEHRGAAGLRAASPASSKIRRDAGRRRDRKPPIRLSLKRSASS